MSTELTPDDVRHLFGPIATILEHHELFFAALSEQTKNWSPAKQIGDVFLASVSYHTCCVLLLFLIYSSVGEML